MMQTVDRVRLLPHTSAICERIFSTVNLNKTKLQNALGNDSLNGILLGKNLLKESACYKSQPTQQMLRHFNHHMYQVGKQGKHLI